MTPSAPTRATIALVAISLASGLNGRQATAAPAVTLPPVSCALLDGARPVQTVPAVPMVPAAPAPSVPAAALTAALPAIRQIGQAAPIAAPSTARVPTGGALQRVAVTNRAPPAGLELAPRTVTVAPGTTVLIEVAIGHLNRLVTPFASPVVHTVSSASTSVDGRVIYLATSSEEPVALWITDGPGNALAISLTLAPRYVPPREMRISVPGYQVKAAATDPVAPAASIDLGGGGDRFGASSYVEGRTDLLRAMAQRRLPPGFQVRDGGAPTARCTTTLKVLKSQLTEGSSASILTLGLRNTGTGPLDTDETTCSVEQHTVAAMGAWPRKTLAAGEETELFLVLQGSGTTTPGRAR